MILYRPVGRKELELIDQSGWKAFPPRLPGQPIFYPVLNKEYAMQIVGWNLEDQASGYCGHVTRFEVADDFVSKYRVEKAGDRIALELWVPADELEEFNQHIVGLIEVIESRYGEKYT